MCVFDDWWPLRLGKIVAITKTRVVVVWSDGVEWRYDAPHLQFLKPSE
jgi:hypothetical protein